MQTAVEMAAFKLFPSFPSLAVFSSVKPFLEAAGNTHPQVCTHRCQRLLVALRVPLFPTPGRAGKARSRVPAKRRPKLPAPALSSQKRQGICRRLLAWSSCPRHSAPRGWGRRLPDAESPGGALGQGPNGEAEVRGFKGRSGPRYRKLTLPKWGRTKMVREWGVRGLATSHSRPPLRPGCRHPSTALCHF